MSDLTSVLSLPAWRELASAISNGRAPQTLAAFVPNGVARDMVFAYARQALCESLSGDDGCPSCRAWREDGHPDMIVAGSFDKAPGIDECRAFAAALALRPVVSARRVGVVPRADGLTLPASNALLKTAEEPPAGAMIVLTAEEDRLPVTLKSRAWIFTAPSLERARPTQPPSAPLEWAAWFESTKKASASDVYAAASGWAEWLAMRGDHRASADIYNLISVSDERRMSVSMVQDALHAVLREGSRVEQLFGDLRET